MILKKTLDRVINKLRHGIPNDVDDVILLANNGINYTELENKYGV